MKWASQNSLRESKTKMSEEAEPGTNRALLLTLGKSLKSCTFSGVSTTVIWEYPIIVVFNVKTMGWQEAGCFRFLPLLEICCS
jgi:hypothetical protein